MQAKIISRELKLETLKLYRNLLKVHQTKLNEEMRVFGDYFVKSEFTMNYKNSEEDQLKMFNNKWEEYLKEMKNLKDLNNISINEKHIKSKMDLDQMKSFNELKNVIETK